MPERTAAWISSGLGICDGHRVVDLVLIHQLPGLDDMHLVTVRMPVRIQPRLAVEADGIDGQDVVFP